jgi:hypothetical protein
VKGKSQMALLYSINNVKTEKKGAGMATALSKIDRKKESEERGAVDDIRKGLDIISDAVAALCYSGALRMSEMKSEDLRNYKAIINSAVLCQKRLQKISDSIG